MARRQAWLIGAVLALVVVLGVVRHVIRSTDSPTTPAQRRMEVGEQNGGVAYGDSATRVRARLGSPTAVQGACWSYHAGSHSVNGEYLGQFVDGLRYCFGDGPAGGKAVMAIYEHIVPHTLPSGKWYPGGWNHAMYLMPASPAIPQA